MIERLKADFKQALKDKHKIKKDMVQMIRANITNLAKEKRVIEVDLTNEDIIGVISKEVKQQNDSLLAFKQGKREDLVSETELKIEILMNYLPKQLTKEEIKVVIEEIMSELNIERITNKERGLLMKELMPRVKGKADGKTVNEVLLSFMN